MIYNRAKNSLLEEKANASLQSQIYPMKHIWMLSRSYYHLPSAFWSTDILWFGKRCSSSLTYPSKRHRTVVCQQIPSTFTLNYKLRSAPSEALETDFLAKAETTLKRSPALNAGRAAFFPHE